MLSIRKISIIVALASLVGLNIHPIFFLLYAIISDEIAIPERVPINVGGIVIGFASLRTTLQEYNDVSICDWVKTYQCATLFLAFFVAAILAARRYHSTGTAF